MSFTSGKRSNKSKKNNNEAKLVCEKTTITATSAGFYFNHSKVDCVSFLIDSNYEFSAFSRSEIPMPEPGVIHIRKWKTIRQLPQVMFGPVPCVLAHDILYLELRNILFQKGKIVNMFLHKASHQCLSFSNCSLMVSISRMLSR